MNSLEEGKKFIYHFSSQKTEGSKDLSSLLGGKGAHLAEMSSIGLPVPPGFTLTSEMSRYFYKNRNKLPEFFKIQLKKDLKKLEELTGLVFGSQEKPLLLSVRSGAEVSMPGMMDTILNLGMNYSIAQKMAEKNPRLAWDCYRRLISMYCDVVLGADASMFIFVMEDYKSKKKYKNDSDLTAQDMKYLSERFKEQTLQMTGEEFPEDPWKQLFGAVSSVFKSWNNPRAKAYRELNSYPHDIGTAVNVQTMVFGNRGKDSATGVVFTRNPSTGEPSLFGEFLPQAQGEDVVAGIRTPSPVCGTSSSLESLMPSVFNKLVNISKKLETHFKEAQDIEFTIEEGQLWILQTRKAKRSVQASIRMALDFVKEGLISEEEAVTGINPKDLEQLLHPVLDPKHKKSYLCKGLPASPGGVSGAIVFSSKEACRKNYKKVILVRNETSPEDIKGMISSQGILTTQGGMTSHAAVVARGMGKCCIVGCHEIKIFPEKKELYVSDKKFKEGDVITLDGSTGKVYQGKIPTIKPCLDEYFYKFMEMADQYSHVKVKANADNVQDAKVALSFGAKGIGLCRTEHMFFQEDRLDIVRKIILFQDDSEKKATLLKALLKKQTEDFFNILQIMERLPVCIRLLDPPLHEFLPQKTSEILELADKWSEDQTQLVEKVKSLKEMNPMLGQRGSRLAVVFPEIYQTQAKALASAQIKMIQKNKKSFPEIMLPLIGSLKEFLYVKTPLQKILIDMGRQNGVKLNIPIGTMIELPQAAINSRELASAADFFSYGSNDLTQTTLGVSRDDCGKFLPEYIEKGLLNVDPFVQIEEKSVGWLIRYSAEEARAVRRVFPLGLCGEHGADPSSLVFLNKIGLTSVSCSPYRIPLARLSLAQAALQKKSQELRESSEKRISL